MDNLVLICVMSMYFGATSYMLMDLRVETRQNHAELIEILEDPMYQHCRVREHLTKEKDDGRSNRQHGWRMPLYR